MTKEEVRAISLDKLDLQQAKRFLDVGAGTGSVSIQAALTHPNLEVVAIEQKLEAIALSQENINHFGCKNITLHEGVAPIHLEGKFDAVFVGGTGGNMREIFDWCQGLLNPAGRLVLNFILLENALEASQICEEMGWKNIEIVTIQASRWTALGKGHYFKPQNATIIISCQKRSEG
ncbi:cobalt-precorrin-6Y C(15)-methyltransferase [Streptococcus varani]|uniref:Cobalt-precorrin-6Y C(15)-methyltransferase n=2 Tax=Streptococcus varani TaxID=1608583 RepID=A0A0E4CTE7_9STRE|nr:cobalt-precorrin-6Y C(15)-methyltransferase [Streptococcus varani]